MKLSFHISVSIVIVNFQSKCSTGNCVISFVLMYIPYISNVDGNFSKVKK